MLWKRYLTLAPWYGLWADEFLVADNSKSFGKGIEVQKIPLHSAHREGESWEERIAAAQRAIHKVCGVKRGARL